MAFYAIFAIAPLFIIAVAMAGLLFGVQASANQIVGAIDKLREEVEEIAEAVESAGGAAERHDRVEEEVGDLLFAIASLARKLGVDPETAQIGRAHV